MSIDTRAMIKNSHRQSKPRRATISALRKPSRPTPSRRRRVTISETSQMVYVADLSNGPQKADIWFTKEEIKLFKAGVSSHVRAVRLRVAKGRASASSILGVEKFLTPRIADEHRRRRRRLSGAVVGESRYQQEQIRRASRREREVAPARLDFFADRLAETAAEHSRWARDRARAAALLLCRDQEIERDERHGMEERMSLLRQKAREEAGRTRPGAYSREPEQSYAEGECPGPFVRAVSPSHG